MKAQLISANLVKLPDSASNAKPSMALGFTAFKGKNATDAVYINGTGAAGPVGSSGALSSSIPVVGAQTDLGPALAGYAEYLRTVLYVAWKVAGGDGVEVRQLLLAEDGFNVPGSWLPLPATAGGRANPRVITDVAPAMAVGADNLLYMVWKKKDDTVMEWSVYDGNSWSDPLEITGARTNDAPSLAGTVTSGPGHVLHLCLAYKGATGDGVFWAMFSPGSALLQQNHIPGAQTDVSPSVTQGNGIGNGAVAPYILTWKPKGESSLCCAAVDGPTLGQQYSFPQANTADGVATNEFYNNTSGFGAVLYDNLTIAYIDKNTGDIWRGVWNVVHNPAVAPAVLASSGNYVFSGPVKTEPPYVLLKDIVVEIAVMEDIKISPTSGISSPTENPKPIGFQINGFSQTGDNVVHWQQYGIRMSAGHDWLLAFAESWPAGNGKNIFNLHSELGVALLPDNLTIPAGWVIRIELISPDGIISGVNVTIRNQFTDLYKLSIDILSGTLVNPDAGKITDEYLAGMVAFQVLLVGDWSFAHATMISGAGTITCTSSTPMTALAKLPADVSAHTHTAEQTDSIYCAVPEGASHSITQTFAASK